MTDQRLLNDIAEYVRNGERDARGFSLMHYPLYGDIPGREIQRLIDSRINENGGGINGSYRNFT